MQMAGRLSRMRMENWFWDWARKKSLETLIRAVAGESKGWKLV